MNLHHSNRLAGQIIGAETCLTLLSLNRFHFTIPDIHLHIPFPIKNITV
jgi:hypothetical protein